MNRRKISGVIIGLVFILAGLLYAGNILDIWDVSLFFEGWWTLFIIVPCIISMIDDGVSFGNVFGLGIGVLLLLWQQGLLPSFSPRLIFPIILVAIGLKIIFRRSFSSNNGDPVRVTRTAGGKYSDFIAIFCGNEANFNSQPFSGADCVAVFGGVELDLRQAIITQDCLINSYSIFGGVDIFLPPNVRVYVDSVPIFGGTSNKAIFCKDENAPCVRINSVCVFGGTEIK